MLTREHPITTLVVRSYYPVVAQNRIMIALYSHCIGVQWRQLKRAILCQVFYWQVNSVYLVYTVQVFSGSLR